MPKIFTQLAYAFHDLHVTPLFSKYGYELDRVGELYCSRKNVLVIEKKHSAVKNNQIFLK